MDYTRTHWVNDAAPPINAANLNNIEEGLVAAQAAIQAIIDDGGGGGVTVHDDLTGRSAPNQHPIGAITGLTATLANKSDVDHDHDGVYVKPADLPAVPTWNTLSGKPAVIAAGTTQATARTAIGAGTSNLTVGTGASNAKAGNWTPGLADIPARSMLTLTYSGTSWPARPTSRTDVTVWWVGGPDVRPSGALVGDIHTPDMEN